MSILSAAPHIREHQRKINVRSRFIEMPQKHQMLSAYQIPNTCVSTYRSQLESTIVYQIAERMSSLEALCGGLGTKDVKISMSNVSARLLALEKMIRDRVQPTQFTEVERKEPSKLSPPPSMPRKRRPKNVKMQFVQTLSYGKYHIWCIYHIYMGG